MREELPFGPPKEIRDPFGQLHCETGPAVITPTYVQWFREGVPHGLLADIYGGTRYFYRDIPVPEKFITAPDTITLEELFSHSNQETRVVGLEIYGYERMLEEGRLKIVHEDDETKAVLAELNDSAIEAKFRVVFVWNSTAEPDGSFKRYALTVPVEMATCKQAIAWTFKKDDPEEYAPSVET